MAVDINLHNINLITASKPEKLFTKEGFENDPTHTLKVNIQHSGWNGEEEMTLTLFGTKEELTIVFQKDE
jgi:hypothetical protein